MNTDQLSGLRLGFALTGSHCTLAKAITVMEKLQAIGMDILPILSQSVRDTDSRFGEAEQWRKRIIAACGKDCLVDSITLAEPIGPQKLLDILLICPCTGNTAAKLAAGITDSPVLMAAIAHLRSGKPLVIALSTNDGLAANAKNIGSLLNTKNIYFVPFGQDDYLLKPNSLIADLNTVPEVLLSAINGIQYQPILHQSSRNY